MKSERKEFTIILTREGKKGTKQEKRRKNHVVSINNKERKKKAESKLITKEGRVNRKQSRTEENKGKINTLYLSFHLFQYNNLRKASCLL
jgi:hypothetical protein